MNSEIEIHDSMIVAITTCDDSVVIRFGPAYVHQSEGRPGIDPGTGWVQDVDLTIKEFVIESNFGELPQDLSDGSLQVGTEIFENTIPLPLDVQASIQFSALSKNGESLLIRGNAATVVTVSEARYVKDFPGSD